jgi:TPR repeat protein
MTSPCFTIRLHRSPTSRPRECFYFLLCASATAIASLLLINNFDHRSSTRTLTNAQLAAHVARARGQIAVGDIAGARLLLEPAAAQDNMDALFALAETYDPLMLRRWRVIGPRPDDAMARALYEKAAKRGHAEAAARLSAQPR